MSTNADLIAGTVMDAAASLMNDTPKTKYTYTVQIPYLNMALQELQEIFEVNEIPTSQTASAALPVDAGVVELTFEPTPPIGGVTYLPDDLIEPQILWERSRGIDPYVQMTKLDNLPLSQAGVETSSLIWWVWEDQRVKFMPSNADNDVKMNYTKNLFALATDETSVINVVNAATFLEYRTAALLAEFIDQNISRSTGLNGYAATAIDRATGIPTKGRQAIFTRRRPFRSGYKRLTYG
jgi:hypothetical protein